MEKEDLAKRKSRGVLEDPSIHEREESRPEAEGVPFCWKSSALLSGF